MADYRDHDTGVQCGEAAFAFQRQIEKCNLRMRSAKLGHFHNPVVHADEEQPEVLPVDADGGVLAGSDESIQVL